MLRARDTIPQAAVVMAVIVLSPYAMLLEGRCGRGEHGPAGPAEARSDTEAPASPGPEPDARSAPEAAVTDDLPAAGDASPRHECLVPGGEIDRTAACDRGEGYPACRWRLPAPQEGGTPYGIWKLTTPDHRWGRPALVALVLAAAREMAILRPGTGLVVGDLDAPGDRHATHASGVDVDLYLPGLMARDNAGGGSHPDNYEGLGEGAVAAKREAVLDLAEVLASCAGGRLRIFYNDPVVVGAFASWFEAAGMVSPFGEPMKAHNDLHLFHFHVTIADDLTVLPSEPAD